jgi:hypothetical protein
MTRNAPDALPTRFRFATDDSARGFDDVAATLQGRLRAIALVVVAVLLATFLLYSVRLSQITGDARDSMAVGRVAVGVMMVPLALLAWWLRRSRPRTITGLRWCEVLLFGGVAARRAGRSTSALPRQATVGSVRKCARLRTGAGTLACERTGVALPGRSDTSPSPAFRHVISLLNTVPRLRRGHHSRSARVRVGILTESPP